MSDISQPQSFVIAPDIFPASAQKPAPDFSFLANAAFADARWNIGGIFLYDSAVRAACDFLLGSVPAIRIESLSGAPPCLWTLEWFSARKLVPPAEIFSRLREIAKLPPQFVLQLDNPFVRAEDAEDLVGDSLLQICSELPQMHVSVASETLAEKIRAAFPKAQLHAGANKAVAENARGNVDYYRVAAEKFFRVALHPEDAYDKAFLEKLANVLPPEKFEIVANDSCLRACPLRREHLAALAKIRLAPWDARPLQERHALLAKAGCEEVSNTPSRDPARCAALLSHSELAHAYGLGFRHFRIQAETLRSEIAFLYEIVHFLLTNDPEFWEKKAFVATELASNVREPVPIVKTGISAFSMRKYD